MSLFSKLFRTSNAEQENKDITKTESAASVVDTPGADDGQIVAAIMAALMNILSETKGELRIKSIRRTGRNTPVWNLAGNDQYIASKL
ncbi:MAG: OadG family protein [Acetivibrionales bacterium]|jgi:hypothetical protein|nr:OadG family protein [Clostridiaceae bacterium]